MWGWKVPAAGLYIPNCRPGMMTPPPTFNRAWSVVDIICIFGNGIGGPNWELKLPGGPGGGPGGDKGHDQVNIITLIMYVAFILGFNFFPIMSYSSQHSYLHARRAIYLKRVAALVFFVMLPKTVF